MSISEPMSYQGQSRVFASAARHHQEAMQVLDYSNRLIEHMVAGLPAKLLTKANGGHEMACFRYGNAQRAVTDFENGGDHLHQAYVVALGVKSTRAWQHAIILTNRIDMIVENGGIYAGYHFIDVATPREKETMEGAYEDPAAAIITAEAAIMESCQTYFHTRHCQNLPRFKLAEYVQGRSGQDPAGALTELALNKHKRWRFLGL